MTQCAKICELLALRVAGELPEPEAKLLSRHLSDCASCQQEAEAYDRLQQDLHALALDNPGDLFFQRQFKSIKEQLPLDADQVESALQAELKKMDLADPGEAFFTTQRQSILDNIQLEAAEEDPATEALVAELQALPVAEPGDLFFERQFKAIKTQIRQEASEERKTTWWKPMAVAAALFFLILGVARITEWQEGVPSGEWKWAVEYMAQEEEEDVGLEDLEDLSKEQLDLLAQNLEGSIFMNAEDSLIDEGAEYDEFDDQELDFLIERLEARVQT